MIDIGLGNKVVIIDPLDAAVQELDILFNTTPTELIGSPNYGMNFFQFLWQTTPSTSTLEKYINDKILANTFYVQALRYDLEVEYVSDVAEALYIVHITLYSDTSDKSLDRSYIIK